MTKPIALLLNIFLFTSCINNEHADKYSQKTDTSEKDVSKQIASISKIDTALRLDFFNEIPDTISGCGEYFTYDTCKVDKDRYIFLSNLTEFAIIKINGKDIYLKKDSIESKEINDKSYIAVYKSQNFKVVLTIKQTKTYDEGGAYSGTLQIIGDKINTTIKVHGESGC